MKKIRVCTLFSGYDSQCMALDRLKEQHPEFDYELVAWAEIDKFAIQAHNAVYPQWADRNYGDVSKIDWCKVPDFDLLTYSSPCQDFSNAGKMRGGEEGSGTRSSLIYERNASTNNPGGNDDNNDHTAERQKVNMNAIYNYFNCSCKTIDILKCCQWLDQHLDVFDYNETDKENFIKDFKKAMEEGQ